MAAKSAATSRVPTSSGTRRIRFKTVAGSQWGVRREMFRRAKARFDALGIEIPYPHMTLYFGEDKEGRAPPANVRTVEGGLPAEGAGDAGEVAEPRRDDEAVGLVLGEPRVTAERCQQHQPQILLRRLQTGGLSQAPPCSKNKSIGRRYSRN